ncbi:hypothetical protein E1301_Tti017269 [Triplophysa tibetana]|uniref:Uncharacterized protein n=1 Tax=Triplophysa tibetana TaxID=1572043 RepID=A0A5A9P8Q6_9TELE|nr:hypothetical protein E1301_Tti017269 [Triplophysa tibetana]
MGPSIAALSPFCSSFSHSLVHSEAITAFHKGLPHLANTMGQPAIQSERKTAVTQRGPLDDDADVPSICQQSVEISPLLKEKHMLCLGVMVDSTKDLQMSLTSEASPVNHLHQTQRKNLTPKYTKK